jgi:hypothetical protein
MAMPAEVSAGEADGPKGVLRGDRGERDNDAGLDIRIRAFNRSTSDTPFCGVGGGMVGDRLAVDAFMDQDGVVTGTAVFKEANGPLTEIGLDRLFAYNGGVLIQNDASQDTVPIWMWDDLASGGLTAALVNVELPRGCFNTVSTFTPGVDEISMRIKFRGRDRGRKGDSFD